MKIRTGFVSNSSSSSFILTDKNITIEEFKEVIAEAWAENLDSIKNDYVGLEKPDFSDFHFIYPSKMKTQDATSKIIEMYNDQYWDAESIIFKYGNQTYLSQALKSHIFATCNENCVPYQVKTSLMKKYGSKIRINYLG